MHQRQAYQHDPDQEEGVTSKKEENRNVVDKEINLIVFKERTVDDLVVENHLSVLLRIALLWPK